MTEPSSPHSSDPATDAARWNKPKMAEFLRVLASTHSVAAAARSVGMSRQSAYTLRNRLKGEPFDVGWETAFQHSYDALHQAALERALHGVEVPVFYKGEQIATRRHYDERLTCFLLTTRNAQGAQQLGRYRAAADFISERWDDLLEQVEGEGVRWAADCLEGERRRDDVDAEAASERYTVPDLPPRSRRA